MAVARALQMHERKNLFHLNRFGGEELSSRSINKRWLEMDGVTVIGLKLLKPVTVPPNCTIQLKLYEVHH